MNKLFFLSLIAFLTAGHSLSAAPPVSAPVSKAGMVYKVPYRLADTKHVIVRAKLNGKGPYNFIMDTGAPALFVSADIADKIGVKPKADGWGTFDRLEIEGGAVLEKMQARIESPSQLKGMNAMGLAGVRIDGVFGFNLLANFRIELDLTQPKMVWTRQAGMRLTPASAKEMGIKAGDKPKGVEEMESLTKMASTLFVQKPQPEAVPRGFFGIELEAGKPDEVRIKSVLADSPAAQGGLKAGDIITVLAAGEAPGEKVGNATDLRAKAAGVSAGTSVRFTVQRDGVTVQATVIAGKGGL